jgi:hypothetical protein
VCRDIDDILLTVGYQWMTWNYLNPFTEYPNRPGHTRTRYKHADRVLGGNTSRLLCTRRPSRQHYRFSPLNTGSSLSMASMPIEIVSEFLYYTYSKSPYLRHYDSSKLPELVGGLDQNHENADKQPRFGLRPPDEILLCMQNGDIDEARIKGEIGRRSNC